MQLLKMVFVTIGLGFSFLWSEPKSIQDVVKKKWGQDPSQPVSPPPEHRDSLDQMLMSIDFVDTDLAEVLRTVSAAYGISLIADKDVVGRVTMHLHEVPLLEGLETLCAANGFELYREGQIFRIRKASEKTINILKMNMQRIDLDVQNKDIKEFIREFAQKTGLKILAGGDLDGTVSGTWQNVVPLDGFKALMEAHGYRVRQKNGFYIVSQDAQGKGTVLRRRSSNNTQSSGSMDIDVQDGKVTVQLEDADLQEVLRSIAEQAHLNIVFYGQSKETVNATIENASFDEVFTTLLKGSRYTYVLTTEGTLLVGEKGAKSALSTVVLVPLKHLKSESALKLVPKSLQAQGLQITDVKEQNALILSGAMTEIEDVRKFLTLVDVPTLQIALECVIVEYSTGEEFNIGLNSGPNKKSASGYPRAEGYFSFSDIDKGWDIGAGSIGIGMLGETFEVELASLERDNLAEVLARPSIATLNGNKALINVTNTTYYSIQQVSKDGLPVNDYRAFNDGIRLEITPSVTQTGDITIDISPEIKTTSGTSAQNKPADVSTRTLNTSVNLRDGQTVRLGGLIRATKNKVKERIPFLGSIPYLGELFSYHSENEVTTELVIYITPRVITNTAMVSSNPGQEYKQMHKRNDFEKVREELLGSVDSVPDSLDSLSPEIPGKSSSLESVDSVHSVDSVLSADPVDSQQVVLP